MKYRIVYLGDIVSLQKGFAFKSKDYQQSGTRIIRVSNLNKNDYSDNNSLFIDSSKAKQYEKYRLKENDAIISTVGSWPSNPDSVVGKVSVVNSEISGSLLNQNAVILRAKNGCIQSYLNYVLQTPDFKNYIIGTAQGSASQASITLEDIKKYQLNLPDIDYQKKIATVLLSFDNKIDSNTRIIQNLELQAQVIFKSWFVDFEPFGGVMPDDWMVTTFDSICDFKNGYAFKSKELLNNPDSECYEVFKQGHILKGGGFNAFGTKSWFPKNKCEKLAKYVLKRKDILMAMTDMKGNVAILGNTAILPEDNRYILNQRVGLLRPKAETGISPAYIYLLTNSDNFLFDLRSRANSGVQVNLSADAIRNSEVVLAPKDICRKISGIIDPLIEIILDNQIENQRLAALRDTLLPKLMNGEIDVSQVKI